LEVENGVMVLQRGADKSDVLNTFKQVTTILTGYFWLKLIEIQKT